MAIDTNRVRGEVTLAIMDAMAAAYAKPASEFSQFAEILSGSIVPAILDEIKSKADVTGVAAGSETVPGGIE